MLEDVVKNKPAAQGVGALADLATAFLHRFDYTEHMGDLNQPISILDDPLKPTFKTETTQPAILNV